MTMPATKQGTFIGGICYNISNMPSSMKTNIPLAPLTTFAVGGWARYYLPVRNEYELRMALTFADERALPVFVLGGGSNVLCADEGFGGAVIHIQFQGFHFDAGILTVAAGEPLGTIVEASAEVQRAGMENLAGIPGTVGGAVRGNAGAFGTEIRDTLVAATAINRHTHKRRTFATDELSFAYRHSFFKTNPEWIIITATFRLARTEKPLTHHTADIRARRERRHLQNVKSAGSFLKTPSFRHLYANSLRRKRAWRVAMGGCRPAG